jgi:hypothetical protein
MKSDNEMIITTAVWLEKSAMPITHDVCHTYQKGDFYCVYELDNHRVFKYPLANIFRICESYPDKLRK